jgi:hypothetical protein
VVGDVGRHLIVSIPFDTRTLILAGIASGVLIALLLIREIELVVHPRAEDAVRRLDGPIVALCVAIGTIVLGRALVILF